MSAAQKHNVDFVYFIITVLTLQAKTLHRGRENQYNFLYN